MNSTTSRHLPDSKATSELVNVDYSCPPQGKPQCRLRGVRKTVQDSARVLKLDPTKKGRPN